MKALIAAVGLFLATVPVLGQEQTGELYFTALNTANPVNVIGAVLDGSTPRQQTFLNALAAAPKKATFVCDNIDSLANENNVGHLSATTPVIDIAFTGRLEQWPYQATVVFCGVMTQRDHVNYQEVDNKYTFGGYASIQMQPGLKLQGRVAGVSFVDFCPGYLCLETTAPHATPPTPSGSATVSGQVHIRVSDVKEWNVDSITVTLVPDDDHSSADEAIRSSGGQDTCDAIDNHAVESDPRISSTIETFDNGEHHGGGSSSVDYSLDLSDVKMPGVGARVWACTSGFSATWEDDDGQRHLADKELVWRDKSVFLVPGRTATQDLTADK